MDAVTLAAAIAAADRRYNKGTPWVSAPYGWDATWKAAKAAQGTTPAKVAFIGTSLTAGQFGTGQTGSPSSLTDSFVGVTRAAILAKPGCSLSGDFYPAAMYYTGGSSLLGTMPYSAVTGSVTIHEGGYGRTLSLQGAQATNVTFTSPGSCTALDIVYVDYASGTWTYSVDGGSNVTVTTTGSNSSSTAKVKKISITGLTSGVHTIAFGNYSATGLAPLCGVSTYANPNAGIQFARSGFSNMRIVDLGTGSGGTTGSSGVSSYPPDKIALWQGQNPGGTSPTTPTGFGFPTQPHLAIIEAPDVNNTNYGVHPRLFQHTIQRLIQALRRGQDACSIVLLALNEPDNAYSDDLIGQQGRAQIHSLYKGLAHNLASTYRCAFVDIDSKWGELGNAKGFLPANDLHPFTAGHADIGNTLAGVL